MNSARIALFVLGLLLLVLAPVWGEEKKKDGNQVPFEVFGKGYFVKNTVKLKHDPEFFVVRDKKEYDEIFGIGFVMGAKPKLVDEKLFEKSVILVVIKAGDAPVTYQVEGVRREKERLFLQYKAEVKAPTSAKFVSPLIVSIPRGDFMEVVFVENGKEIGGEVFKKKK